MAAHLLAAFLAPLADQPDQGDREPHRQGPEQEQQPELGRTVDVLPRLKSRDSLKRGLTSEPE
jgi:hypothetical protein